MKAEQFTNAFWAARFAPYVLIVTLSALVVSMFWSLPPLAYLPLGITTGGLVFLFQVLRLRTGRELFQAAAMASWILPMFYLMSRLRGKITMQEFQYVAIFVLTYVAAVGVFHRRVLRGLNHEN